MSELGDVVGTLLLMMASFWAGGIVGWIAHEPTPPQPEKEDVK